ncbi:hypothetical protein BYT27DRAFT_7107079 [Phlegmacium glaucopus]|nr:hypothetical protein BYT27DRAFT_7107079 [Phlegmacium glaucopus]
MLDRTLSDQALNPPFTQATNGNPPAPHTDEPAPRDLRRPSEGWLRNPAWIDGGINPPVYYLSHEEIEATCHAHGVQPPPRYMEVEVRGANPPAVNATPALSSATQYDILSARVSPTPITPRDNYYHQPQAEQLGSTVAAAVAPEGYLVNATHLFTPQNSAATLTRTARVAKKKQTLLGRIGLGGITRVAFIKAFLEMHNLHTHYGPGIHSGPPFKLSWTGSAGGKAGAPTFLNDDTFNIAISAILKKDRQKIQLTVEFDTDTMSGFRIQQPVGLLAGLPESIGDEELMSGTGIPHVGQFSNAEQVNGRFVVEIKKRWPCAAHQGEHGGPGHCYVTPNGDHIRLNPLRMKMWAAAMATGDVTKHEPPSTDAFDGVHDARVSSLRARGRAGPFAGPDLSLATPPSVNNDAMTLVMASLIPILGGLSRKRSHSDSDSPRRHASSSRQKLQSPKRLCYGFRDSPSNPFQTPSQTSHNVQDPLHDSTSHHNNLHSPISSMPKLVPAPGFELRACLRAFAELDGVDITPFEIALRLEDFTPDIIALADETASAVIRSITGVTNGRLMKLKVFCKKWQVDYEKNISSGDFTTYELE